MKRRAMLIGSLLLCFSCEAQTSVQQIFRQLSTISSDNVTYTYTMWLMDAKGKSADSINGKLIRHGTSYYDSSTNGITVVDGDYYCKIDYANKFATVYNISLLQKKLNLDFAANRGKLQIIDSILATNSKVSIDTTTRKGYIQVKWTRDGAENKKCQLLIDRVKMKVLEVRFDNMPYANTDNYCNYRISQIADGANTSVFNLNRFFAIENGNVRLTQRYARYQVKQIIK